MEVLYWKIHDWHFGILRFNFSGPFFCVFLQDVKKYKLGHPRTFHYLNQSDCYELKGVDESKEYSAIRNAMDVVGIGSEEQVFYLEFL